MDQVDSKGAEKKPLEKLLLKDERILLWGYLASKCPICGIHQPFEVYAFEPSFFEKDPISMLAKSVRPLADLGGCPLYDPLLNQGAHYLHICVFCDHYEVSETPPERKVDVFWEPVDRFRILARTTAADRSCINEKRHVSSSAATRFFRSALRDRRYFLIGRLGPIGVLVLLAVVFLAGFFGLRTMLDLALQLKSPKVFSVTCGVVGAIGALLIYMYAKRWRRHSFVAFLMLRLHPFSLEFPTLLKHALEESRFRSVARALKPLVDAQKEAERTAT